MQKFTAEEIFEANENGEPIQVSPRWVRKVVKNHHLNYTNFVVDNGTKNIYDACDVLAWMGRY